MTAAASGLRGRNYARNYWPFLLPAGVVVLAVIIFPWLFTLYMSVHEFKVGGDFTFIGLDNYLRLTTDDRFLWSVVRTL